jgi:hypothetical protein
MGARNISEQIADRRIRLHHEVEKKADEVYIWHPNIYLVERRAHMRHMVSDSDKLQLAVRVGRRVMKDTICKDISTSGLLLHTNRHKHKMGEEIEVILMFKIKPATVEFVMKATIANQREDKGTYITGVQFRDGPCPVLAIALLQAFGCPK